MPYNPTVTDQSGALLARGLASATETQPLSEEELRQRMELLRGLGMSDDNLLMRGAEWRRGWAEKREAFRDDAAAALRKGLGFKDTEAAGALGSAAKAAKAAKFSL